MPDHPLTVSPIESDQRRQLWILAAVGVGTFMSALILGGATWLMRP